MYSSTTHDIRITVDPTYLEDQSEPDEDQYVWAYQVKIENGSGKTVTLRHRYWQITDAKGRIERVSGPGVLGEQPTLAPGESFTYTSGAPLSTPSGFMMGSYEMEDDDGESFQVQIPAFSLDSPYQLVCLN